MAASFRVLRVRISGTRCTDFLGYDADFQSFGCGFPGLRVRIFGGKGYGFPDLLVRISGQGVLTSWVMGAGFRGFGFAFRGTHFKNMFFIGSSPLKLGHYTPPTYRKGAQKPGAQKAKADNP